jgi:hypothetical protein
MTGMFRDAFDNAYTDSPELAEELLLPLLGSGNDIHAVSAFVPSYVYKLFELLRAADTTNFGLLNLSFFVPHDLGIRTGALAALVDYFSEYVEFDGQIANFAADGLELAESGIINLNLTYSKSKRKLARGCAFVVVDGAGREDYVAMVDSKGGDWNSPLVPARSWVLDQQLSADDVLSQIAKFNLGENPKFFRLAPEATATLLSETFAVLKQARADEESSKVPQQEVVVGDGDEDLTDEFEPLEDLVFSFDFDEVGNVIDFEELDDSETAELDAQHINELLELSDGLSVHVGWNEVVNGHAPPLPPYLAHYYPALFATCVCGEAFNRADGCPSFSEY